MNDAKLNYQTIAKENGVDLDLVKPLSNEERIKKLESTLALEDVPYPIPKDKRESYLEAARSGEHFGIGIFSDQTVDLR